MKLLLNCKETAHKCDKAQYNEATIWEKIKLKLHILICGACRNYVARNSRLTEVINTSKPQIIPREQKEAMKEQIRNELSK